MKLKICGQTSLADATLSIEHGADFIGVIYRVGYSARSIDAERIREIFELYRDRSFLVTSDFDHSDHFAKLARPYALQLAGQESPELVRRIKDRIDPRTKIFKSIHFDPIRAQRGAPDESALKSYLIEEIDGFVFDTALRDEGRFGGTGLRNDWSRIGRSIMRADGKPVFLAGGIDPDNVACAVEVDGIYGIDLVSGVEIERAKGRKSKEKLARLAQNFKLAIGSQKHS